MPETMFEHDAKYAFISAAKKNYLDELVPSLVPEYTIITMGRTEEKIKSFNIPDVKIISPEEFLGDTALKSYLESAHDEIERRDRIAVLLGHRMSRTAMESQGEPLIDFVYIHLGTNIDVGGAFMIASAVMGKRSILTQPSEIAGEVRLRRYHATEVQQQVRRREQGRDALRSLGRYYANHHVLH